MFGAIKKFFGKSKPAETIYAPGGSAPTVETEANPFASGSVPPLPDDAPAPPGSEGCLEVAFAAILRQVPNELYGKIAPAGVAGHHFCILKKKVIEQLPRGAVKVTFGELRRSAPTGVFISGAAHDAQLIDLPMGEILKQLQPQLYARRADQRQVNKPADIEDLFGTNGERLMQVRLLDKEEAQKAAAAGASKPDTQTITKPVTAPTAVPTAAPVAASAPAPAAAWPLPPSVTRVPVPIPVPAAAKAAPITARGPASVPAPASVPIPATAKTVVARPVAPVPLPVKKILPPVAAPVPVPAKTVTAPPAAPVPPPAPKIPMPAPPAPKPAPIPSASPAAPSRATAAGEVLAIALADLMAGWPETVRREISRDGLEKAKCELPVAEISGPLKQGLVQFPWRQLRAWLKPALTTAETPETAGTILDLPLRIIAPLYLGQSRAAQSQKKIAVDNDVPDLFQKGQAQEAPRPPAAPKPAPRPEVTAAPRQVAPPASAPSQTPAPVAAATAAAPAAAPGSEGHLILALALISGNWPEQVKKEIALHNLADCKLEVPFQVIEQGLKQGRIEYRWRHICQWMKPPPPAGMASADLGTRLDYRLELPLNIVAPLFLQSRTKAQQKKAELAGDIPELFSAAGQVLAEAPPEEEDDTPAATVQPARPQPASVQPAPVQPAPAQPAPAWPAPAAAGAPRKAPQNLAEMFGEPEKRHWTPNEIVNKTCHLPGVTGSLIALQDGLLVASCMPPSWTTETIAAFLPQIFGRMNQYTKELKMGELKSVSFNITCSTLQIFNAGIIYFAALGHPGEPLPTESLTIIADELSRHTK